MSTVTRGRGPLAKVFRTFSVPGQLSFTSLFLSVSSPLVSFNVLLLTAPLGLHLKARFHREQNPILLSLLHTTPVLTCRFFHMKVEALECASLLSSLLRGSANSQICCHT